MSIASVIESLTVFEPQVNDAENMHRLYQIFEGFRTLPNRETAMPAMFALLERFPDAELGSPGPVVHELEAIPGNQQLLKLSLMRLPTDLTVWMVNRILNSKLSSAVRAEWLAVLSAAAEHPLASSGARESAREFIRNQGERGNA